MGNKIIKTIIRTTALCMTILAVSMHAGTTIVNASETNAVMEQDSVTTRNELHNILYSKYSDAYVYAFKESRNFGVAIPEMTDDSLIYNEGLYGIRINVDGNDVVYEIYKHNSAISDTAQITLYEVKEGKLNKLKDLKTAKADEEYSFSHQFKKNTLYVVGASFEVGTLDDRQEAMGFIYNDNGETVTCRVESDRIDAFSTDREITRWTELMKGIDPKNYLSNDKITYPTSGSDSSVTHVKQWEDISDAQVRHDDWTDEMKVFAFADYLAKNIAYDDYRTRQPNNQSRASIAKDYTKDKYFTLGNNVGVCWDYTNILTIMCRHHGIPCTSVENQYHTVNAVWLGDEWVSIDVTDFNRYNCNTEDTDKDNWVKHRYSYRFYGGYGGWNTFDTVNESIWTYEKGLGLK